MKATTILAGLMLSMGVGTVGLTAPQAGATGFTYVGRLSVTNGVYDMRFTLYDSPAGSEPRGRPVVVDSLIVTDGCFTAVLDFGCDMSGGWLEIDGRWGNSEESGAYNALGPRRLIAPAVQGPQSVAVFMDADDPPDGAAVPADAITGDRSTSTVDTDAHYAIAADVTTTSLGNGAGTTGSLNTFLGYIAGRFSTGGSNTFAGGAAGYANTTGSNNTFLGYSAGDNNIKGTGNTFTGCEAGLHARDGSNNTFLGYQAGYSYAPPALRQVGEPVHPDATGNNNTFSGTKAGYSITTGEDNTFSGFQAGFSNTTGNSNTFVGYNAGYANVSGGGNVFIGYYGGFYEKGSDKLYIANSAKNNPLIYGDFATGRVGIGGLTNPTEKLDINGTARLRGIAAGGGTGVVVDGNGKLLKTSSSARYKKDIETLAEDADKVLNLRPVRFRWQSTGEPDIGLIAEEVAGVLDSLVIRDAEGRPEAVKYDKVALYLVSVIQTQQQQIEAGKAENRSLAQDIKAQQQRIEALEQTVRQMQIQVPRVR